MRVKRLSCPLFREASKLGINPHNVLMNRFDFWRICPEEGKYGMAVAYHRRRLLSLALSIFVMSKYELV